MDESILFIEHLYEHGKFSERNLDLYVMNDMSVLLSDILSKKSRKAI